MDEVFVTELKRLYKNIEHSSVTSDFYNRVYEYVLFLNKNKDFKKLLLDDDKKLINHIKENQKTVPKQKEKEDDIVFIARRFDHIGSGESQFLNNYYLVIKRDIFDPLYWHYVDNKTITEADIMLNSIKKKKHFIEKVITKINNREILPLPDLYDRYIDKFYGWKNVLRSFHILLLEQIKELDEKKTKEVKIKELKDSLPVTTHYDKNRCLLVVNGIAHKVSRKSDKTDIHYILEYIFDNDPKEEHFYRDMEDFKILGDPKKPLSYYKALHTLNDRLIKETGINDFFEKITTGNTGSVKINRKYL